MTLLKTKTSQEQQAELDVVIDHAAARLVKSNEEFSAETQNTVV